MNKLISIIIPTRNEQKNIGRCLQSIIKNGYPHYEIIVVDQNSTDKTIEIVKKYSAKIIKVNASENYIPPSQSRNKGFAYSKGDIIYHLDADMELEHGLLAEIVFLLSNPKVSAVVIPETDIPTNYWSKGKAFERSLYYNTDMEAARATKRIIFSQIFYEKSITSGEDWYIHNRYQKFGQIKRTTKKVKHHIGSITLKGEFKKKFHYGGKSKNYVIQESNNIKNRFSKLLSLYIRGIIKNIFVSPSFVFAFIIIRIVDVFALTTGYFIYIFKH